ncbi:YhgE/Pip N-terminal domain [Nocardia otitidiscaviarum]|uniref:YhgE/Pip N-terminal domain n=1 Tax=Nocardia otitidiscaviarum TaxID=1823 RepID=A0A378YHM0_9NOCA|nr:YhgE/Pip N-terminal domain [Nocardia otitidiscaviarum]
MTTSDTPEPTPRRHLTPIKWGFPIIVVTLLASLLGVMYLDYVVDPEENLHDFPIALVNQDVGDTIGAPGQEKQVNFGDQVAAGLREAVPADKIDLRELGINEAQLQMQQAQVYGTIIIPSDFSKRLGILGVGSVVPGDISKPVITLQTNPRTGAFATAITQKFGEEALSQVQIQVGKQLTEQVNAQLAPPPDGPPAPELTAATRVALAEPLNIVVEQYRPLPNGSGEGLTAFFYSLLLLLVGMVGAMIIHQLIDSALGFLPTEWGPWYVHFPRAPISRTRTLLLKWAAVAVMAVAVSAALLGIGAALGMPIDKPLLLFIYGAFVIIAVGFTCTSVLAAVGTAGLIVNLIIFIILGLPSSGGTVPIEATPKYFGWLANFEPMHQVFLGTRAILYFNGSGVAGLTRGVWMAALGLAIGVVFGLVITRYYDHKGLERKPLEKDARAAAQA